MTTSSAPRSAPQIAQSASSPASPFASGTAAAPLVIFDLDGTLIDTAPDLLASLNHVLALTGHAPVAYEDMTWLVGQGAKAMIERAWALHGHPASPEQLETAFEAFLVHYAAGMPGASKPYPGLLAALDRLQADGFRLAVCTNKTESLARSLLEGLGMSARFDAITGGDTFAVRKPHGDHVLGTIRQVEAAMSGAVSGAVMVGDSVNDIRAAQNAGIPVIAVPFGYTDKPVETLGPDVIIQHFDELDAAMVRRLINATLTATAP